MYNNLKIFVNCTLQFVKCSNIIIHLINFLYIFVSSIHFAIRTISTVQFVKCMSLQYVHDIYNNLFNVFDI
jgi:hypothetical protein